MTAEQENLKHTKPCRVDGVTSCVQYPEEEPCDCDWCADCEVSMKSATTRAIMVLMSHDLLEEAETLRKRTQGCQCNDCEVT